MELSKILFEILEEVQSEESHFPKSFIYNEEWMTKLLLTTQFKGNSCLPFCVQDGSTWFSEAHLLSPFLKRKNLEKDNLAERQTQSDAVIGQIKIRPGTKSGLSLTSNSSQFIVLESKIYSSLSPRVSNAKYYDQAARSIACMAKTIEAVNVSVDDFNSLGFYVIAPVQQIEKGKFKKQMDKENIIKTVKKRMNAYSSDKDYYEYLNKWYTTSFNPLIDAIEIECISWEDSIKAVKNNEKRNNLHQFYKLCLKFST